MFGWFRPTCPVEPSVKQWLEWRLQWLTREFGPERLLDVEVILPTPHYFPDPYDGSKRDARVLLDRVCRYMDVDPDRIRIQFFTAARLPGVEGMDHFAAGLYEGGGAGQSPDPASTSTAGFPLPPDGPDHLQTRKGSHRSRQGIRIEESNLSDPLALAGTLAHELGHVHLLGDGRISSQEEDHEPLTDLLTVFFGMGIFTANSVLREASWQAGQTAGWSMARLGYLTMDMYGYAFALFAWYRGEGRPAWARYLRGDVHSAFKRGLRYLTATGDSLFKPLGRTDGGERGR